MARVAVYGGVRSGQREAIVVLLHLLYGNLPSPHRVALFAIGSELPAVDVGVAVLTSLSYISKHWLRVAPCASYRLVHPAKWIARLIVVKLGYGADRLPGARRMAVLARNSQIPVRAVRASRNLRSSTAQ